MTISTSRVFGRVVALAAMIALFVVALRTLDFNRLAGAFATINSVWIIAAAVCYAIILPLWALLWTILAPPTRDNTWARMLGVVILTSTALNTTPLLVGEVAGAMLLVSRLRITVAQALSVSAMDQLLVGVAKVSVVAAAVFLNPVPSWMMNGLATLLTGVIVLSAACLIVAFNDDSRRWPLVRGLPDRALRGLSTFAHGLNPLRSVRRGVPALALALTKKCAEVLAIICVQHALGLDLPASSALLVLAALNLATIVPLVPGNIGVYEGVVAVTYTTLGVTPERAAALAVVQHACYFAALALPGFAWAAVSGVSRTAAAAR